MRKVLIWVCTLVLIFSLGVPVLAANDTIALKELGISLSLPSDYMVLTRSTPANDPLLELLEISHSELISYFESDEIYMDAISVSQGDEIILTASQEDMVDFNDISDTLLELFAATVVKQFAEDGVEISSHDVYQATKTKFLRLYIYDDNVKAYGLRYCTVYNSMFLSFTMCTYDSPVLPAQETVMQNMADSLKFTSAPTQDNKAFLYTDSKSGAHFTVPGDWIQQPADEDTVEFLSAKDNKSAITYGSHDLYGSMTPAEKADITRGEMNNDALTVKDVAELYETSPENISMVTYNGITYFKGTPGNLAPGETDITLCCFENGWMYLFAFTGSDSLSMYSDFERLMSTVELPATPVPPVEETQPEETTPPTEPEPTEPAETTMPTEAVHTHESQVPTTAAPVPVVPMTQNTQSEDSQFRWIIIGATATMTAVVVILLILVLYRKKRNTPPPTTAFVPTELPPTVTPEPTQNSLNNAIICKNCGAKLPPSHRFCTHCGAPIDP